jgi:MIP family channel proteins
MIDDLTSVDAWRDALAEFFATGLFIFIGAGAVVASGIASGGDLDTGRLVAIALAHGLAIALLVYATGHLSGGHLNPAVTLAAVVSRKIGPVKGAMYVVSQLAGAILAALLLLYVMPDAAEGNLGSHALGTGMSIGMGFTMELVLTFLLVFVVFSAAMDKRGPGVLGPLAVGLAVLVIHLVAVPLTGAGVNPARSLGPALASGSWADHWVYWLAPLAGGVLAAGVYQTIFAADDSD